MSAEPFEGPVGLADRLDDLVVRVEDWAARSRPILMASIGVAVMAVVGWWAWRSSTAPAPVDDLIPLAAPGPGAEPGPGPSGPTGPATVGPTDGSGAPDRSGSGSVAGAEPGDGDSDEPAELVIHVVGEVRRPGLVTVAEGARVSDAVEAAGGPTGQAELDRLNLATPLVDGMQIRVPAAVADDGGGRGPGQAPLIQLPTGSGAGAGGVSIPSGPVDLNRASVGELESLPGIGPALAGAIAGWRDEHGGFTSVDQLEAVPGIGPAKLAALRDLVVV